MNTFCKLKNGKIFVVFSENTDDQTIDLISVDQLHNGRYDAESATIESYKYSDIAITDRNIFLLSLIDDYGD